MKARTLKEVSRKLDISEKTLRGIQRGEKRSGGDISKTNMAKCLGTISKFTGYKSKEHAAKAIEKNIRMLYISGEQLAKNLSNFSKRVKKSLKPIIQLAVTHLKGGKLKSYNKLMQKIGYTSLVHVIHTKVDETLIDRYREERKQDTKAAKKIRGKKRFLIKSDSAITRAVNKRARRWGVTASLFWEAALKFNPNPKVKGVISGKKKLREKTKGASVKTAHKVNGLMTAKITHHLEKKGGNFRKKLNSKIKQQEKYWGNQMNKEILAYMAMDRLLGK
jgi:hypothetical protein